MSLKFKRYFRLIFPKYLWSFLSLLKFLFLIKDAESLKKIKFKKANRKAIVLGNGPSLKNDLEEIVRKKDDYDLICVNNFCSSQFYEVLKPSMYVFLDNYFFNCEAHSDWIEQREKTFNIINKNTTWPMQIFFTFLCK